MNDVANAEMSRAELEAEVALYRQARVARLTADKGWLTLIGKFWLTPGRYRVGSAPGSEILLPADRAPADLGTITLENGVVTLDANPSAELMARGERVKSMILRSDAESNPDDIVLGSLTLQLIRRGDDLAIRVRDSKSAARLEFPGLPAFDVDPAWRFVTDLDVFSSEREVIFDDSDGRPQPYLSPGVAVFERAGVTCRLLPVFESDRKRLFVLFSDLTNRDATYGAGRFLYVPLPEGRRVVLDFNKAFNPPCAFTPYAVCPLPAAENRLAIRVEAGEKRPLGIEI
jgi:uncharacterized protein (DUF1684 family)